MSNQSLKILVIGSSSFAAQGLIDLLSVHGHEVWSLNRRPESALGPRGLAGGVTVIGDHSAQLHGWDVVVNYLLMKDSSLHQNLQFLERLDQLLQQVNCKRFIHISSISVLAPGNQTATERDQPPKDFRQKGNYAQLKIATELWVARNVTHCQLVLVRPGFVVGPGLLNPIVGIGKLLPTQAVLGLGHPKSAIPIIDRRQLNQGVVKLCTTPLEKPQTVVMFTDPISPQRKEYLDYCCDALGMGRRAIFLPSWLWRVSLAAASVPLSAIKREWTNLPARFNHNLKRRRYDPAATQQLLDLSLHQDWKTLLHDSLELQEPNFVMPAPFDRKSRGDNHNRDGAVAYIGMGRIARERHLPALKRLGCRGSLEWCDPFLDTPPVEGSLRLSRHSNLQELKASRVVITTPVGPRLQLLRQLPITVQEVLFEKPFASAASQFCDLEAALGPRSAYVIHNYRFKPNVQWAFGYLATHHPGQLQETRLHFDSPAVDLDRAAWMRNERQARTLLVDYAIHFLDLAWIFAQGRTQIKELEVRRNVKGQTMSVSATVKFNNHVSRLFLRQGARQQRCQLEFVFSNYSLLLRFFPDLVTVIHGQHTFVDDLRCGFHGFSATARKIAQKLGLLAAEPSHQLVLGAFLGSYKRENIGGLSLEALRPFYHRLFALAEPVYGERVPAVPSKMPVESTADSLIDSTVQTMTCHESLANCAV